MLVVPTPAQDDSGATHALEHMVLCGSRRFPYRDAFFKMERRSMALHLNAVTNEWLSTYHFHTPSEADFYNLLQFLVDGVFDPLLLDETFAQEVVRQIDDSPPSYSGVVYNEMRALTAMPGIALDIAVRRKLFADSAFGHLSGGAPTEIERLRRDRVVSFHRRHYRLSNELLVSSGDIDMTECQRMLDRLLGAMPAESAQSTIDSGVDVASGPPVNDGSTTDIELAGGLNAVMLAWDRGWRADEYAWLEAHLLLDLLSARPDSLLRQQAAPGLVAAPHLNVVDGQASRTVLRLGFGHRADAPDSAISHETVLEKISRACPEPKHLNHALDRLELMYVSGGLHGSGVDPVSRLRQTAEKLCAEVDDSVREGWLQQGDPMARLRRQYQSPQDCMTAFRRLCDDQQSRWRFRVVNCARPRPMPTDNAAQSTTPPNRTVESADADPLPIVSLADVPEFPQSAVLDRVRGEVASDRTPAVFTTRNANASISRTVLTFRLPVTHAALASALVHRIEHEARSGALRDLVSTQLQVDGWAAGRPHEAAADARARPSNEDSAPLDATGGIKIVLRGLVHHADEQRRAVEQLLRLQLGIDDTADPARLQAQYLSPNGRAERLQLLLRSGHVTAVSAALSQQPGLSMLHYGSGLGLLPNDRSRFDEGGDLGTHLSPDSTLADCLHHVIVDAAASGATESDLMSILPPVSQATPQPQPHTEKLHDLPRSRSLIRITGSVNYLARAYVMPPASLQTTSMAVTQVLAAAARNVYLLDAIRGAGGAYGTGVELIANAFAIWSYRDPRLEATFNDFSLAVQGLAQHRLSDEQLHEAKLSALTQLAKRYSQSTRPPASLVSLVEDYQCGQKMQTLCSLIKQVDADAVVDLARQLGDQQAIDVALAGQHWRGSDAREFDGFDYRDQSLVR